MSERVLLECLKDDPFVQEVLSNHIHPHPGVPVADLLEEAELAARFARSFPALTKQDRSDYARYQKLWRDRRAAREAAQEPKLKEGQEVWVRAEVKRPAHFGDSTVVTFGHPLTCDEWYADPGDIRTEEPPEIEDVFQPARYTTKELTEIANACYAAMHRRVRTEL